MERIKKIIKIKKAFTLVELMGVLVIIGILTTILIPIINNIIKENKEKDYQIQLQNIVLAAKNLGSDNSFVLPIEKGESIFVSLAQLISMGYLEDNIKNPKTGELFSKCLIIEVKKIEEGYDYTVDESSLENMNCDTNSNIIISEPSKKYIKNKMTSYYLITVSSNDESDKMFVKYDLDNSKINLEGAPSVDSKFSITGENGIYKLTIQGGATDGKLVFNLNSNSIVDESGNDIVGETKKSPEIIVDNTPPEKPTVALVNWEWERILNNTWSNEDVYVSGKIDSSDPTPESNDDFNGIKGSGIDYFEISKDTGDNKTWYKWKYLDDKNLSLYYINGEGTILSLYKSS